MAIFKSHKVSFIAKLVLLIPLSYVAVVAAMIGTGGGHGNYFPSILICGPTWILSAIPVPPHMVGTPVICGVICLYMAYALLLKFVKSNKIFFVILISHIMIGLIIMLFGDVEASSLFEKNRSVFPIILGMNTIIFALWGLVFWLLKSIHKSRGLW